MSPPISDFMTTIPVQVDKSASLETARRLLERYGIRHLPVMADGKLVGVVTEREMNVALAVARSHSLEVTVETAMQSPAFQVGKNVPVGDVAERMAKEKFGCAIVVHEEKICGIFTTTDALFLLTKYCKKEGKDHV